MGQFWMGAVLDGVQGEGMTIVLCPGIHDRALTQSFRDRLLDQWLTHDGPLGLQNSGNLDLHCFEDGHVWGFSALHLLGFLEQQVSPSAALTFIGFSAGVVGAIGAAWAWHQQGRMVQALIALDGWGVPLVAPFPIHRLSHDRFTHWSSQLIGAGMSAFYADPAIAHLELWRSPHHAWGWWSRGGDLQRTTAVAVIAQLIQEYEGSRVRSAHAP